MEFFLKIGLHFIWAEFGKSSLYADPPKDLEPLREDVQCLD